MTLFVVIDEVCQECQVASEPVGIFTDEVEANRAAVARDEVTNGWRDGGQTSALVHRLEWSAHD